MFQTAQTKSKHWYDMFMKIYDAAGWLGVGLILLGYFLVTFSLVDGSSLSYSLINLFGAVGIIWSSYVKKDMQPVALNIVWLIIATISLIRLI